MVWVVATLVSTSEVDWLTRLGDLFLITSYCWYLQYLALCYAVFYVSWRWAYRFRWPILIAFNLIVFLFWGNIQAEQSLSFMTGVLLAERKDFLRWVEANSGKLAICAVVVATMALGAKQIAMIRMLMENQPIFEHAVNLLLKFSIAVSVICGTSHIIKFLNINICRFIGNISYELYLVHLFLVLRLVNQYLSQPAVKVIVFIGISYLLAWLLYKLDGWTGRRLSRMLGIRR